MESVVLECAVYRWHPANRRADAALCGCGCFVSASLMETYGLTLVEAMACGTPVVASRVGGVPEAAPNGQGAILAVMKLRNSPQLREVLREAGREIVCARNSLSAFSIAFEGVYRESASSGGNAQRKQSAPIV